MQKIHSNCGLRLYIAIYTLDVNECEGDHPCHVDGECVNIFGGFYCTCGGGFNGDGVMNCTGR